MPIDEKTLSSRRNYDDCVCVQTTSSGRMFDIRGATTEQAWQNNKRMIVLETSLVVLVVHAVCLRQSSRTRDY